MTKYPDVDDLRLAVAVHRHGSVGAAARELVISQPAASARLAALERRLSVELFERDTTGARATPAGTAFATEAEHIIEHLAGLPARTLAGLSAPVLRAGTFPSLAGLLFPALDEVLAQAREDMVVDQLINHGEPLIRLVAEGALDVAVVGIAAQLTLPPGVASTPLGTDRLATFIPQGVPAPSGGRKPLAGSIPFHCVDLTGPEIAHRISKAGGVPRRVCTGETAVLTARRRRTVALLARAIAVAYSNSDESVTRSPVTATFTYHLVTRSPAPELLRRLIKPLVTSMGLSVATGR